MEVFLKNTLQFAAFILVAQGNFLNSRANARGSNWFLVGGHLVLIPILRDQAEKWVARKGCGLSS